MAAFKFSLVVNNSAVWLRLNGSVNKDMNFSLPCKTSHILDSEKLGSPQAAMIAKDTQGFIWHGIHLKLNGNFAARILSKHNPVKP